MVGHAAHFISLHHRQGLNNALQDLAMCVHAILSVARGERKLLGRNDLL